MSEAALDFTNSTRRRNRSIRDIQYYWDIRYGAFLKAGFTDKESAWAADNGLLLRKAQVKDVLLRRKKNVLWYMNTWGYTRTKAIQMCAEDLEEVLPDNIVGMNLFYEKSL